MEIIKMLEAIHPKLPMRNKLNTKKYYCDQLGFVQFGANEFPDYLMVEKDNVEIHFFLFPELIPKENYGQVYIRVKNIDVFYDSLIQNKVKIHPNAPLQIKPWGQKEFSLLDPDMNLLTFGESV